MRNESIEKCMKIKNNAECVMVKLQAEVQNILNSAKRTSANNLFKKDTDLIKKICGIFLEQERVNNIQNILFYDNELLIQYFFSVVAPNGVEKTKAGEVRFKWYDGNYSRVYAPTIYPENPADVFFAEQEFKALKKEIQEMQKKLNDIQRVNLLSQYGDFIGEY
ncbi:hypothetical protein [Alishewanella phage vB_AspM_Slicko01]|nr:hypothetical protein [Alishewanella phage vB_AspM_Slicko01]